MSIKASVTEYLQRARDCTAMADKMTGADKAKMVEIAEAWLKVADEAAKMAVQTGHELPKK